MQRALDGPSTGLREGSLFRWPLLGHMEDMMDGDRLALDDIDDDIGALPDYQFPGAGILPGFPE